MSLVRLRPEAPRCRSSGAVCGRSSSGRARPCQGRGSEFEPRRPLQKRRDTHSCVSSFLERHFCCAKVIACGRMIEREWGNPSKVPPSHSPFLAVCGSANNKTCGRSHKETPSVRMVFSFWNVAGRLELAASTGAKRVKSRGPAELLRMALPFAGRRFAGFAGPSNRRFFAFRRRQMNISAEEPLSQGSGGRSRRRGLPDGQNTLTDCVSCLMVRRCVRYLRAAALPTEWRTLVRRRRSSSPPPARTTRRSFEAISGCKNTRL